MLNAEHFNRALLLGCAFPRKDRDHTKRSSERSKGWDVPSQLQIAQARIPKRAQQP